MKITDKWFTDENPSVAKLEAYEWFKEQKNHKN